MQVPPPLNEFITQKADGAGTGNKATTRGDCEVPHTVGTAHLDKVLSVKGSKYQNDSHLAIKECPAHTPFSQAVAYLLAFLL